LTDDSQSSPLHPPILYLLSSPHAPDVMAAGEELVSIDGKPVLDSVAQTEGALRRVADLLAGAPGTDCTLGLIRWGEGEGQTGEHEVGDAAIHKQREMHDGSMWLKKDFDDECR
jgi:C-terminal processing protease CtpA/Prc